MLAAGLGGVVRGKVKRTTIPDRLLREPGTWSAGDAAPARADHPGGRGHAPTHPPGQGGCTRPSSLTQVQLILRPSTASRSAPEDAGEVALDLRERGVDAWRGSQPVVNVKPKIAVAPLQRPTLRGGGVTQPGDREACPLLPEAWPPGAPPLHDRQVPRRDLALDANLVASVLWHTGGAPPLYSCHIQLRQAHLGSPAGVAERL